MNDDKPSQPTKLWHRPGLDVTLEERRLPLATSAIVLEIDMNSEPPIPAGAGRTSEVSQTSEVCELVDPVFVKPTVSMTWPAIVVILAVIAGSLYANLSCLVTNRADFRFFPPFIPGVNRNQNDHLAAEYYSIATAIVAGRGFSDPFREQTGPTAWMPPILCWVLAGLRWVADGDKEIVVALFVLLQDLALIFTGLLIVALARLTVGRVWLATALFVGALAYYFRLSFQFTHDCWMILLALDLVIAGMVWMRPFESSRKRAALWGICGGLFALTGPIVGFTWAVLALGTGLRQGRRGQLAIAVLMSILTISPWVIRNYLIFGRLIPVKSNLAYELYQSQCLQAGGVLGGNIFGSHPYAADNEERWHYRQVGEMQYLDEKWKLFAESVEANPMDFVERVANRFFAARLEYVPFSPGEERSGSYKCMPGLSLRSPGRYSNRGFEDSAPATRNV